MPLSYTIQTLSADFLSEWDGFCWDCLWKDMSCNLFISLLQYELLSLFWYIMFVIIILTLL